MIISLAVLLVPVVLLVGGYQVLAGRTDPVAVDPAGQVAAARADGVPAVRPQGLADDWTVVAAAYGDGTLRLGYQTPGGGSVQLVHSTVPADELLAAELADDATPAGRTTVAGAQWQHYDAPEGRALVRLAHDATVLIHGSAPPETLAHLAAALPPSAQGAGA